MDRRSFLNFSRSGVLPQTPWDEFCHRVQRIVPGYFKDVSVPHYIAHAAEIVIERLEDIRHLYAYCYEYGITLVLKGFTTPEQMHTRHVLIVSFSEKLNTIETVGENVCLVQPSVKVGELLQQGYQQFTQVPEDLTVAQWFASPQYHDCRPYHSFLSGVERISVFFADGSQAVLGGFGVNDSSALSVPILNRCIPSLFELLQDSDVQMQLEGEIWPYAYRIDTLKKHFVDINLARLFQGHRSQLAWIQQWVIRKIPEDVLLLPTNIHQEEVISVERINNKVKELFDAESIFICDDEVNSNF